MFVNFCQEFLKTTVTCDTITTEGYEVDNLLKANNVGFLAYSCIRPPVNIDFTFACWIKISHIVVWPKIGAQKSSGFRVSVRSHCQDEFRIISSSFLKGDEAGALFVTSRQDEVARPRDFSEAFLGGSPMVMERIKNLRLSIVKTDKSVPAIDRIEIWGFVSQRNSNNVVKEMEGLVLRHSEQGLNSLKQDRHLEMALDDPEHVKFVDQQPMTLRTSLDIPESFLDPITCTIMQQPIVLPSGKVIDQSTLEKYGESQAMWGRSLNDPFSGIPFTDNQRPVFASMLKARIDKFLLENSESEEIKTLPRVLGRNSTMKGNNDFLNLRKISATRTNGTAQTRVSKDSLQNQRNKLPRVSGARNVCKSAVVKMPSINQHSTHSSLTTFKNNSVGNNIVQDSSGSKNLSGVDNDLENNLNVVMARIKRFHKINSSPASIKKICSCCDTPNYYYKFPCNHFTCRKTLVLTDSNHPTCNECGVRYASSEMERINV